MNHCFNLIRFGTVFLAHNDFLIGEFTFGVFEPLWVHTKKSFIVLQHSIAYWTRLHILTHSLEQRKKENTWSGDYYSNVPGNKAKLKSVWLSQHHPATDQSCTPSDPSKDVLSYDLNVTTLTLHTYALSVLPASTLLKGFLGSWICCMTVVQSGSHHLFSL